MRARLGPGLALFLIFQGLFLLTASGRVNRIADEFEVYLQVESLWDRGSLAIPQVPRQIFFGKVGRDGQPYAPYGPGSAFLALPHHGLARASAAALGIERARVAAWKEWVGAVTSLASSTWAALAVLGLFRACCALGASQRRAALVAALLGGTTMLWPYGTLFFSEPAAAMALAWFLAWKLEERTILAACALGVLCLVKGTYLIWTPCLALIAIGDEGVRGLLGALRREQPAGPALKLALGRVAPFVLAGVCALSVHVSWNLARYGAPFDYGYVWTELFQAGAPPKLFSPRNLPTGLFGLLFSPGKSLFLFAPAVALALGRIAATWRERPSLAAAWCAGLATGLLFYGCFMHWDGGFSFGPRHFVPLLPLFLLPLALGEAPRQGALALVVALGLLVQGLGVTVSYLEDQAAGLREDRSSYYSVVKDPGPGDPRHTYRFGYTPLVTYPRLILNHMQGAPGSGRSGLEFLPLHLTRVNTLYQAGIPTAGVWGVPALGLLLLVLGGVGGPLREAGDCS